MITIPLSSTERNCGTMTPEHLDAATRAMREDGFVVLQDVVDLEHIAILRDKMIEDVAILQARTDAPFNWNAGNVQQEAPPFAPYLFRDILLNEMAIEVTRALLGPGVKNFYYSGNTAVNSAQRQPVHADSGQLWRDLEHAHPPVQLVVNVPLVDVSAENGSTEIWPGTHRDTSVSIHDDIKVSPAALEPWRAIAPPIQPQVLAGSILIRDIRLWHAGMPNRTLQPRPMIAMIHAAGWFETPSLKFPRAAQEFFAHPHLRTVVEWTDEPIDYLRSPQSYQYEKSAK